MGMYFENSVSENKTHMKGIAIIVLTTMMGIYTQVKGQGLFTMHPTSPISASFEKYGDYPVSLYTGVPAINIPLYVIDAGECKIPISLSYHASGIKANDAMYPVGLGWTLNADSRISRTVLDKDDQYTITWGGQPTYMSANASPVDQGYMLSLMSNTDGEPDLFSYNLNTDNTVSGRFILKETERNNKILSPLFMPQRPIKLATGTPANFLVKLMMTDEHGFQYKFNTRESSATSGVPAYTSSWLLDTLIPPSGSAEHAVYYSYTSGAQTYTIIPGSSIDVADSVYIPGMDMFNFGAPVPYDNVTTAQNCGDPTGARNFQQINSNLIYKRETLSSSFDRAYQVSMKYVSEIKFNNGRVTFTYNAYGLLEKIMVYKGNEIIKQVELYTSDFVGSNDQKQKLDSVIVRAENESQKYSFVYNAGDFRMNGSPVYDVDYWGYFNGANNENFMPKWSDVPFVAYYRGGFTAPDYYTMDIGYANRNTNEEEMKKFMLTRINYPTGGYTAFEYEANRYLDDNQQEMLTGGLRVKKIESNDGSNPTLVKTYKYGINENGMGYTENPIDINDFIIDSREIYTHLFYAGTGTGQIYFCGEAYSSSLIPDIINRKQTFLPSPRQTGYMIDGSTVWYEEVAEYIGTNTDNVGKTVYKYEMPIKTEFSRYQTESGDNLKTVFPSLIYGYDFPALKEQVNYKNTAGIYEAVRKTENNYIPLSHGATYCYPLFMWATSNTFLPIYANSTDVFTNHGLFCNQSTEIQSRAKKLFNATTYDYSNGNEVATTTEYEYDNSVHEYPTRITRNTTNGNKYLTTLKYPIDYVNISAQDNISKGILQLQASNVVSDPVEEMTELLNSSYVHQGVVKSLFREYKVDKPFVSKVYQTENASLITDFVVSSVNNGAVVKSNRYKEKVNVSKYSDGGRILEQSTPDGEVNSYIWGFNEAYVIAEIKNAPYAEVAYSSFEGNYADSYEKWERSQGSGFTYYSNQDAPVGKYCIDLHDYVASGSIQTHAVILNNQKHYILSFWEKQGIASIANSGVNILYDRILRTKGQWRLREIGFTNIAGNLNITTNGAIACYIDELRLCPETCQIATYTYDPLVGMTCQTDNQNRIIFYEYDSFNRLKIVKDQDGHILKRICYNYAGQPSSCSVISAKAEIRNKHSFIENGYYYEYGDLYIAFYDGSEPYSLTAPLEVFFDALQKLTDINGTILQSQLNNYSEVFQPGINSFLYAPDLNLTYYPVDASGNRIIGDRYDIETTIMPGTGYVPMN
jgi:hypothetical protein